MGLWSNLTGSDLMAYYWSARSKLRVELRDLGEGLGYVVPRVEGTASGWFHRAATTSRSRQWKDNGPVPSSSSKTRWIDPSWTVAFFLFNFLKN